MYRENISGMIKDEYACLFIPKNGGLNDYVNSMLPEIGIPSGSISGLKEGGKARVTLDKGQDVEIVMKFLEGQFNMTNLTNDKLFMQEALKEAKLAYDLNEVPVGCVIVKDNEIIARAHNIRETSQLSTAHAEMIAIEKACKKLKTWRLEDCDLYVTLEPCLMCSGAIINSRIMRVIYGALEPKFGAHKSLLNVYDIAFNHKVLVTGLVLAEESNQLLKSFFQKLRNEKN